MAERIMSRPWSEEEDALLRQAIAHYGENDNWKNIALSVPGRTNKACRKRWLHSLQPNVKKTNWTPSEDDLLTNLYEKLGPKWSSIARQIPGRTDDACSKRYREALDPNLKKDQWSPEEDEKLMDIYNHIGGKWRIVSYELRRSGLDCRNRWRLLERKKASRASQNLSPSQGLFVREVAGPIEESPSSMPPQEDVGQVNWPPYYPPEAYSTFPVDEGPIERPFREPTPESLDIPDPQVAPFQYSSSSLSAALSDPPRPPPPLPPVSAFNTPELVIDTLNDSERQPSLSPLSQCNGMPEMRDVLMSLEDSHQSVKQRDSEILVSQPTTESDRFSAFVFQPPEFYSASPLIITSDISRNVHPCSDLWHFRGIPEVDFDNSPLSVLNGLANFNDGHDDLSSTSSTPHHYPSSLSPTSSPNPVSLVDLPNSEHPSSNSLLFSPPGETQAPVRRPRKFTSRKPKPSIRVSVTTRLSSSLPLSGDPNVRPYACGLPTCWPTGTATSLNCFTTSGDLLEHSKDQHPEEDLSEKPYRCALPGCGKSWKSINGLQYHLQISTAHFTHALFSIFSAQQPSTPDQNTSSLSTDAEIEDSEPERKFACPLPGCFKAYRQPSGLRYHVKHGHPRDMPVQLAEVPPALERQIPTKAKKLRAKPLPEVTAS